MKTITAQKPLAEIQEMLKGVEKVYLIGCGTCATLCHTGGKAEVLAMKDKLTEAGKTVTGWMVIPTACDDLTHEAIRENAKTVGEAQAILAMTCAFGVQTIVSGTNQPVYPALDTLFIGKEGDVPGHFSEICMQCGECVLGWTAGICPVTRCAKGLLNGPCGGYRQGKCEVDPTRDCAWIQIYERLKKAGQLDKLRTLKSGKAYSKMSHPRRTVVEASAK